MLGENCRFFICSLCLSKKKILCTALYFKLFVGKNKNGSPCCKEGDTYTRLNLADTLERIAKLGFQDFYQGRTAKNFVKDLRQLGGIITLQDLKDYW